MISPHQVLLAVTPVDMRLGIDGLSLIVQQSMGHSPCDGRAYAFINRQGNRIKLLVWDGTGVWLCTRRLHQGRFRWPLITEPAFTLNKQEWSWLTMGVDWQRLQVKPHHEWRV